MKPVVKLVKGNMKGGLGGGELYEIKNVIKSNNNPNVALYYEAKCNDGCYFFSGKTIYPEYINDFKGSKNVKKKNLPIGTKLKRIVPKGEIESNLQESFDIVEVPEVVIQGTASFTHGGKNNSKKLKK